MWINQILKSVLFCFLILGITACGNSAQPINEKQESQKNINVQFKQAQNLFDSNQYSEAYKIYKKLVELGDAQSQNAFGNGYQYGYWGEVDLEQAKLWYEKAADQGYAGSIHNLGMFKFRAGEYKQALEFFEKAAALYNPESLNIIGVYYSQGIIFQQDYDKALEYFYQAAKQNSRDAQFNIGQAYYYGHGVKQDYKQAYEWYIDSANQDYSLAQIQLADMYFEGEGIEKDVAKAIEIIKPLAELGDEKAKSNLQWYLDHPN